MSTMTAERPAQGDAGETYLTLAQSRRRHPRLNHTRIYRAVVVGLVRTQNRPGYAPLYNASDIDRLISDTVGRKGA